MKSPNNRVLYRYGLVAGLCKAFALVLLFAGAAEARSLRILAFGDSLTQGYGLIEEEGLVPQLQSWLDAEGVSATIINGGVSGDTTAGGAARIDWSLSPDIGGVIVTLGGNDMLRGLPPEEAAANLEAIIQSAKSRDIPVMLIGMDAPLNYGVDYKTTFEAIYPTLAEKYGLVFVKSYLAPLGATPADALKWMQQDGIHPNAKGVTRIVQSLGAQVRAFVGEIEALTN